MNDAYRRLAVLLAQQSGRLPPHAQPFSGLRNEAPATLPPMVMPKERLENLYGPLGIGAQGWGGPEPTPSFKSPQPAPMPQMSPPQPVASPPPPQMPPLTAGPMPEMFDAQGAPPILDRYAEAERRLRPDWLTNQGGFNAQQQWWA